MFNSNKKLKKEQKEIFIPKELQKSFTKPSGPRENNEPFSIWFSNIVFKYHPTNLKMF